jgi:hypothetical protein
MSLAFKSVAIATTLAAMMVPAAASAQQASSRGMSGNMNLMRIENRLKVLEVNNARMQTCQQQGMLYLPGSPKADEHGCTPPAPETGIDYTACTTRKWVHSNRDLYCPTGNVMVAAKSRRSDSGEWNGFICCPLGEAKGSPPTATTAAKSGGGASITATGGGCGGGDTDCTAHPYASDPSDPASWNGGTGLGVESTKSR